MSPIGIENSAKICLLKLHLAPQKTQERPQWAILEHLSLAYAIDFNRDKSNCSKHPTVEIASIENPSLFKNALRDCFLPPSIPGVPRFVHLRVGIVNLMEFFFGRQNPKMQSI